MKPSKLPELPWQKVGTDLFEWDKHMYVLIVDYYSRFIEIARLSGESAPEVINKTKSIFARHGIPETVISDNGPQFTSESYETFAKQYEFEHKTGQQSVLPPEQWRGRKSCQDHQRTTEEV